MSIIHDIPTAVSTATPADPVRDGAIRRARAAAAEAHALLNGTGSFLDDPTAPVIWGRMTASLDCLVWLLTDGGR